ncbi:MAG: AMP-binding protein [Bacteroidetes bacterium]|nr:AMP-binding protein [Bacteroidota bacterium]
MNLPNHSEPLTRVFDLLNHLQKNFSGKVVFGYRRNGQWETISVERYIETANKVSFALKSLGIKKGDTIITLTPNRPEFNCVDMGALQIGAIHVPLYPSVPEGKLIKILQETNCRIAFISAKSALMKILSRRSEFPALEWVVAFDPVEGIRDFNAFLSSEEMPGNETWLEELKSKVKPEDPASVIYISGGSTAVKGVVLTHGNHVFNILNYAKANHVENVKSTVSLLPLAHSYERTINYCQQYFGVRIWYNDKIPGMQKDFKEIRPEMVVMVPLLIERLFTSFEQQTLRSGWMISAVARKAIQAAKQAEPGKKKNLIQLFYLLLGKLIIFPSWRKALGGKLHTILCGGAALNPAWLNLSNAMGIAIYEGYGITEAGPLVSYNLKGSCRNYSVGKPMNGVEVKILPDGEVCVRSDGVMAGYYAHKGASHEAVDRDGWLHTGDLGTMDALGFLTLTGVKKEIFKLSSGLYVNPKVVEEQLRKSRFIKEAWVSGHNRNFLVAILIPDFGEIKQKIHGLEQLDNASLITNKRVNELLTSELKTGNSMRRGPDQVLKFTIVNDEWTVENGFLKENKALDRVKLQQHYAEILDSLYSKSFEL